MASFMPDTEQKLRATNAALTNAHADNNQLRIQNRQLKAEKDRLEARIVKLTEELSKAYTEIDNLNKQASGDL